MDLRIEIEYNYEDFLLNDDVYEYFETLAEKLKFIYSREFPSLRQYHYKKLDFTLVVAANLEKKCFNFVRVEGDCNKENHTVTMRKSVVNSFFKEV